MENPYHYDLDRGFRGRMVRLETEEGTYTGIVKRVEHGTHSFLLEKASFTPKHAASETPSPVSDDDEQTEEESTPPAEVEGGLTHVHAPTGVMALDDPDSMAIVNVGAIEHPPYHSREFDPADIEEFARKVRKQSRLESPPLVARFGEDSPYIVISGNRRVEAALRAGLETITVRVRDLNPWEAAQAFVDAHIPLDEDSNKSDGSWYSREEARQAITELYNRWDDITVEMYAVQAWCERHSQALPPIPFSELEEKNTKNAAGGALDGEEETVTDEAPSESSTADNDPTGDTVGEEESSGDESGGSEDDEEENVPQSATIDLSKDMPENLSDTEEETVRPPESGTTDYDDIDEIVFQVLKSMNSDGSGLKIRSVVKQARKNHNLSRDAVINSIDRLDRSDVIDRTSAFTKPMSTDEVTVGDADLSEAPFE